MTKEKFIEKLDSKVSKINEEYQQFKIYQYDKETRELIDTLVPSNYESAKTMLYNLSDKDNGYLIYPKPLNISNEYALKNCENFMFRCRHIYENNGNFLNRYGNFYFTKRQRS